MSIAAKAALTSSVVFILLLVGWNYLTTQHRSMTDLSNLLWIVPLFAIVALLNWLSLLAGRLFSPTPIAAAAVAFVLLFGLTLSFSEAMRSLGGKMTPLQIIVTAAFALFNAGCLITYSTAARAGA